MVAKDILSVVKQIADEKEQKRKQKDENIRLKLNQKEVFERCKERCSCKQAICAAKKLKQCPSCQNVLKSHCC